MEVLILMPKLKEYGITDVADKIQDYVERGSIDFKKLKLKRYTNLSNYSLFTKRLEGYDMLYRITIDIYINHSELLSIIERKKLIEDIVYLISWKYLHLNPKRLKLINKSKKYYILLEYRGTVTEYNRTFYITLKY
jgi:hypothetical protein